MAQLNHKDFLRGLFAHVSNRAVSRMASANQIILFPWEVASFDFVCLVKSRCPGAAIVVKEPAHG